MLSVSFQRYDRPADQPCPLITNVGGSAENVFGFNIKK